MDWYKEFPQQQFLDLIASGKTELQALGVVNESRGSKSFAEAVLVQLQIKKPAFRESLEEAKKRRADVWFSGIAESVAKVIEKEEVPAEKLKFEQRKYLAAIDNPDKYSEKIKHSMDVNVNIFQEMKDLSGSEVKKIMESADPFNPKEIVDAEFEMVEESGEENEEDDLEGILS
ncbi:MAG: hypothetical protein H0X02_00770 [Nitrosomonas sp.]|nr:hypothetical protein [Nitrosomonas sp.]